MTRRSSFHRDYKYLCERPAWRRLLRDFFDGFRVLRPRRWYPLPNRLTSRRPRP